MIPFVNLANPLPTTPGTGLTEGQEAALATATRRQPVASIAALKALTPSAGDAVNVLGYYAPGDGGGGQFYYDVAASDADNGGTILAPTAGGGRWKRVWHDTLSVKMFGAKGDGVADDTTAFTAALVAASASGVTVRVPAGNYAVSSIDVAANINVIGDGRRKTKITITGFATYAALKYGVLLRGEADIQGRTSLGGVEIDLSSSAEPGQHGILITRRALLSDVRVHHANGSGIYFRSVNQSTEAPYFSSLYSVFSDYNEDDGIKITENCSGITLYNCETIANGAHGLHTVYVSNGQPLASANIQVYGGQSSYNQKHGIYLENGWHITIAQCYSEYNSAIDGGNPPTGAYKNLHMGGTSYSHVLLGGQGEASGDLPNCVTLNASTTNFVSYGGYVISSQGSQTFGYNNAGAGINLTLNGAADCQHIIDFRETTINRARLRYDGANNLTVFEVWNGTIWAAALTITNTGHFGFYGATAVSKPTVTGATGGNAALQSLVAALTSLGLITNSTT